MSSTSILSVAAVGGALYCASQPAKSGRDPRAVSDVCEAATGMSVMPVGETGTGTIEKVGDMDVYVAGSGERCVVLVYDIFGFSPSQTRHNCDWLAAQGFLVIMPDLFRGSGRRDPNFKRPQDEDVDRELAEVVLPFAKAKGGKTIGIVGFCFGGGAAMRAASTGLFASCGGVHASGMNSPVGEALVGQALSPVMLLQAGGDPELSPVHAAVKKMASIEDRSVLRTYWDQNHGWCGATGNRAGDERLKVSPSPPPSPPG
jgi:dienelactone hydrolase